MSFSPRFFPHNFVFVGCWLVPKVNSLRIQTLSLQFQSQRQTATQVTISLWQRRAGSIHSDWVICSIWTATLDQEVTLICQFSGGKTGWHLLTRRLLGCWAGKETSMRTTSWEWETSLSEMQESTLVLLVVTALRNKSQLLFKVRREG